MKGQPLVEKVLAVEVVVGQQKVEDAMPLVVKRVEELGKAEVGK